MSGLWITLRTTVKLLILILTKTQNTNHFCATISAKLHENHSFSWFCVQKVQTRAVGFEPTRKMLVSKTSALATSPRPYIYFLLYLVVINNRIVSRIAGKYLTNFKLICTMQVSSFCLFTNSDNLSFLNLVFYVCLKRSSMEVRQHRWYTRLFLLCISHEQ